MSRVQVNPFSTRYIKPGSIQFESDEIELSGIIRVLQICGQGQIVGPHGSGKSTLVASLLRESQFDSIEVRHLVCRSGLKEIMTLQTGSTVQPQLLVIDGFEQFGWLARAAIQQFCRKQRMLLLITSHKSIAGLPVLARLSPSSEKFVELAGRLQAQTGSRLTVNDAEALQVFVECGGNMREGFMSLYDRYQVKSLKN